MKLYTTLAWLGATALAFSANDRAASTTRLDNSDHGNTIWCYYTNWSQYRPGAGKFYPEDMDPHLCTHLIFSFAKVVKAGNGWSIGPYEWNDLDETWMEGMYSRFNKLKLKNPELKTLIAVGGWNHGNGPFTDMVATDSGIDSFVKNSMNFARENGFNGIDLDWEYPGKCTVDCSPEVDIERFRTLSEKFRNAIEYENADDKFILSAAVGCGRDKVIEHEGATPSYSPKHMTDHFDMVNLMSYDLHGHWEAETGHHALAHKVESDDRLGGTTNLEWVLNTWIDKGANPSKLALGLASFGRSFKLENPSNNGYRAPCKGSWTGLYSGSPGPYTREGGYLAYYEVCEKLNRNKWQVEWLDDGMSPYAHGDGDWVGYDNRKSINYKVDMAKEYHLGGIMWWAVDIDDFRGEFCGEGKYPLLTTAYHSWQETGVDPTDPSYETDPTDEPEPTYEPTTDLPEPTEPPKPTDPPSECEEGEFYADPQSCTIFYQCNFGKYLKMECAKQLFWDTSSKSCNWAYEVDCCDGKRPCPKKF